MQYSALFLGETDALSKMFLSQTLATHGVMSKTICILEAISKAAPALFLVQILLKMTTVCLVSES